MNCELAIPYLLRNRSEPIEVDRENTDECFGIRCKFEMKRRVSAQSVIEIHRLLAFHLPRDFHQQILNVQDYLEYPNIHADDPSRILDTLCSPSRNTDQ